MTDQPPFPPFNPQPQAPAPEKPKRQNRKKKLVPTITAVSIKADGSPPEVTIENRPRQKRKKSADAKASFKIDLTTALAVADMLNADDQPAFEKLIGILQDAGKPGRERLLSAIGKIFA